MIEGVIDYNGMKEVPCKLEFQKTGHGNIILLHLPENVSVSNVFHAFIVLCDLPRVED